MTMLTDLLRCNDMGTSTIFSYDGRFADILTRRIHCPTCVYKPLNAPYIFLKAQVLDSENDTFSRRKDVDA